MKKTPYLYNTIQSEEIQEFISDNFGKGGGYIAHELKSEYVHTDTMLIESKNADRTFVTFGMGARKMNTPNNAKRCELVMYSTKNIATESKESFIISGELARISKFPFREDTWLGTGHTMDASEEFKETFGYDFFAFKKLSLSAKLNMIKTEIVPTDEDYYIKCPTERKFDDCCNEFWNVATYVSKKVQAFIQ